MRCTKSPSMSFDRDTGDIVLERRRGGHSCVPEPGRIGGGGEFAMGWKRWINYYKSSPRAHVMAAILTVVWLSDFPLTLRCVSVEGRRDNDQRLTLTANVSP